MPDFLFPGLWIGVAALLWFVPVLLLLRASRRRRALIEAWDRSPEGRRLREAMDAWLLGKARLERAEPTGEPAVIRAMLVRRRKAYSLVREERVPMRLHIRLLPIGGDEVSTEAVVTIPTAELADLTPGRIFSVLYDPRDPRRFTVDTLRRDGVFIDGVTMRTQAAEENARAAQAFGSAPR